MTSPERWRSFREARSFARSLGLLDRVEWVAYARGDLARIVGMRPDDIPATPWRVYRDQGWSGARDWLGPPPIEPEVPGHIDFRRARTFARSLGLSTAREWRAWCGDELPDMPTRPVNVPDDPESVYPRAWRGWKEWLGTETRPPRSQRFLPFEEARDFVRALEMPNVAAWRAYCRGDTRHGHRPSFIPACPDVTYRHRGWQGYGDWLGTGALAAKRRAFLTYDETRALVVPLGLRGGDDYRAWMKGELADVPPPCDEIPWNPQRSYRDAGWTTWGDFLGTGNVGPGLREFPPFATARRIARRIARRLGLANHDEWAAWRRGEFGDLPAADVDLPANPDAVYRDRGWTSWGDFLGTGFVAVTKRRHRSFAAARRFVRSLGLSTVDEWRAYVAGELAGRPRLPRDVPASPESVYRGDGWNGWPDYLGRIGYRHRKSCRQFAAARALARSLGMSRVAEWREWLLGDRPDLPPPPEDLPLTPYAVYAHDGWAGWDDFLGTGRPPPHRIAKGHGWRGATAWRSFEDARAFARRLGLRSGSQWTHWRRTAPDAPEDLPVKPHAVYARHGWRGWGDFLGTGNVRWSDHTWRRFDEARAFARTLGLRRATDWSLWHQSEKGVPRDIPATPRDVYASSGWNGWGDFLGTGNVRRGDQVWREFDAARAFVRTLGLRSYRHWQQWRRTAPDVPADLPACPDKIYVGRGWNGWPDFLRPSA